MKTRAPFLLHFLAVLFLATFFINLAGILQQARSWNWLLAAGYYPTPFYVIFKAAFLGICGLVAAAAWWSRARIASWLSMGIALITMVWFWVDRLLLTHDPLPFKDHLFMLLFSLVLLAFVIVSSWLLEPYTGPRPSPGEQDE